MTNIGDGIYYCSSPVDDGVEVHEPGFYWHDEAELLVGPYKTMNLAMCARDQYMEWLNGRN